MRAGYSKHCAAPSPSPAVRQAVKRSKNRCTVGSTRADALRPRGGERWLERAGARPRPARPPKARPWRTEGLREAGRREALEERGGVRRAWRVLVVRAMTTGT